MAQAGTYRSLGAEAPEQPGTEPTLEAVLRRRGVPSWLVRVTKAKGLMYSYIVAKLVLAAAVASGIYFTDLRVYEVSAFCGFKEQSMRAFLAIVAVDALQDGVFGWVYCWRRFHEPDNESLRQLLSSAAGEAKSAVKPRALLWEIFPLLRLSIVVLFPIVEMRMGLAHGGSLTDNLLWMLTKEPIIITVALASGLPGGLLEHLLDSLACSGTLETIESFTAELRQSRDFAKLTTQHKQMDDTLEGVWYQVYGWAVLNKCVHHAASAFLCVVFMLVADRLSVRIGFAVTACGILHRLLRHLYDLAVLTERCTKTSAGKINGQISILRTASQMFGELEDRDQREAHANFFMYLQSTQVGVELPLLGLMNVEKCVSYSVTVATVVPTGMAVVLAFLKEKHDMVDAVS